jgi:hypothetical protein
MKKTIYPAKLIHICALFAVVIGFTSAARASVASDASALATQAAPAGSGNQYAHQEAYIYDESSAIVNGPSNPAPSNPLFPPPAPTLTYSDAFPVTVSKSVAHKPLDLWIMMDANETSTYMWEQISTLVYKLSSMSPSMRLGFLQFRNESRTLGAYYQVMIQPTIVGNPISATQLAAFQTQWKLLDKEKTANAYLTGGELVPIYQIANNASYWRPEAAHVIYAVGTNQPGPPPPSGWLNGQGPGTILSDKTTPTATQAITQELAALQSNNVILYAEGETFGVTNPNKPGAISLVTNTADVDWTDMGSLVNNLCYATGGGTGVNGGMGEEGLGTGLYMDYISNCPDCASKLAPLTSVQNLGILISALNGQGVTVKSPATIASQVNPVCTSVIGVTTTGLALFLADRTEPGTIAMDPNSNPRLVESEQERIEMGAGGIGINYYAAATSAESGAQASLVAAYNTALASLSADKTTVANDSVVSLASLLSVLGDMNTSYSSIFSGLTSTYPSLTVSPTLSNLYTGIQMSAQAQSNSSSHTVSFANSVKVVELFYNEFKTALGSGVYNAAEAQYQAEYIVPLYTAESVLSQNSAAASVAALQNLLNGAPTGSPAAAVYRDMISIVQDYQTYVGNLDFGDSPESNWDITKSKYNADMANQIQKSLTPPPATYSTVSLDMTSLPAGLSYTGQTSYSGTYSGSQNFTFNLTYTGKTPGTYNFNIRVLVDGAFYTSVSQSVVLSSVSTARAP